MMIYVFVETCADGCTVSMGISPSRLSRRTLDLIENQLASKRSFSAETVRFCVADLARATSPPCGRRLVSRNFISKNLRFTQADSRCIIIALHGSSQNRVTKPISQPGVLAHLPGQGHGVPLCLLAAQGMYTGFEYSVFKVRRSGEKHPLLIKELEPRFFCPLLIKTIKSVHLHTKKAGHVNLQGRIIP